MSSNLANIQDALYGRVQLLTSEPEVAWAEVPYVPVIGRPYIAVAVQGRNRMPMAIGPLTPHLWQGTLQIVVLHPANEGSRRALRRADAVIDHFPRSLTLTAGTGKVLIEAGTIDQSYTTADWLNVPVIIRWFSEEF